MTEPKWVREYQGNTEFEREVLKELRNLSHDLKATHIVAEQALNMADEANTLAEDNLSKVSDHERTLYGHEDSRRRVTEPGLVHVVSELAGAFKDVRAVAKAGWAMLGLVGISTAISMFSIFLGTQ
jgi:hypothetical protein